MARPAWYYQRQAEYATARETYYRNRQPNASTTVVARPTTKLTYKCLLLRVGTSVPLVKLPCSDKAITFFQASRLNLIETVAEADVGRVIPKPYGFSPSKVSAMKGTGSPRAVRAFNGTGRRMVRYTPAGIDNTTEQAYYSAPIADDNATPTVAGVRAAFKTLATALQSSLGDYGRIGLELEKISFSES